MKFKPLNNLHLIVVSLFYICPIIPLNIGCFIVCLNQFDFLYFITCTVFTLAPVVIWALVRMIYPYRYIIDDEYITKLKGKKLLFKIKRENLKATFLKKATFVDYFKFIFSSVSYYNLSTAYLSCISFVFDNYESVDDNTKEIKRLPLSDGRYPDCREYVEILSYKKAQKVYKTLNEN